MARNNQDFTDQLRDMDDRVRRLEIDGSKWTLECSDPYGFWKIRTQSGPVPEVLKGQYTSQLIAEKAIRAWVLNQSKKVESKADRIEAAIYKPTVTQKKKLKAQAEAN